MPVYGKPEIKVSNFSLLHPYILIEMLDISSKQHFAVCSQCTVNDRISGHQSATP